MKDRTGMVVVMFLNDFAVAAKFMEKCFSKYRIVKNARPCHGTGVWMENLCLLGGLTWFGLPD
jgi:hypothetical protein